jgi:hypothetical protein
MSQQPSAKPGAFQKGFDPRRHTLTREERRRGGRAAFLLVATHRPDKVKWLQKKRRLTALVKTKLRYRIRRRLYARGLLDGPGY